MHVLALSITKKYVTEILSASNHKKNSLYRASWLIFCHSYIWQFRVKYKNILSFKLLKEIELSGR